MTINNYIAAIQNLSHLTSICMVAEMGHRAGQVSDEEFKVLWEMWEAARIEYERAKEKEQRNGYN